MTTLKYILFLYEIYKNINEHIFFNVLFCIHFVYFL